ncbi:MAG: hypothetical protein ACLS4A_07725 [Oscillospiraceae bacterium]
MERFYLVTGGSEERVNPRWDIDICCTVTDEGGDSYRFLMQMVNKSPVNGTAESNIGYLPKVFNAGVLMWLEMIVSSFRISKLDHFRKSHRKRPMVHVVAENTSAAYHEEDNSIRTDNIF